MLNNLTALAERGDDDVEAILHPTEGISELEDRSMLGGRLYEEIALSASCAAITNFTTSELQSLIRRAQDPWDRIRRR